MIDRRGTGEDCMIAVVVWPYDANWSISSSRWVTSRTYAVMT